MVSKLYNEIYEEVCKSLDMLVSEPSDSNFQALQGIIDSQKKYLFQFKELPSEEASKLRDFFNIADNYYENKMSYIRLMQLKKYDERIQKK